MRCLLVFLTLSACDAQSFVVPALSRPMGEEVYGAVLGDTSLVLYGNSPTGREVYAAVLDGPGPVYNRDRLQYSSPVNRPQYPSPVNRPQYPSPVIRPQYPSPVIRPQYPTPVPYSQPTYRPVPFPPYNPLYRPVTSPPRRYAPTAVPYSPRPVVPSQVYRPPVLPPNQPISLGNPPPVLSAFPIQPVFNQSLPIPINRVVPPGANAASLASSYSDGTRTGAQSLSYTG